MPVMLQYIIKLSISLGVIYLFYALVLRRLTFYNWNRWYLLGYSLMAFCIPFINISPLLRLHAWEENALVQWIPVIELYAAGEVVAQVKPEPGFHFTYVDVLAVLFVTGIIVLLARLCIQYLSYLRIKSKARLMADDTVKVYQVDKKIIPFSFGNAIYINQHLHTEKELEDIIRHEFIHVKQKHTADILWAEVLCMLNWYNPFAWLLRKAIRQNLEFIADSKVLQSGIDKKHYQYLLLKVMGNPALSIVQQFNFTALKNRIAMMNKIKSARIQLTRFMFLLPLAAVLLLAFRGSVSEQLQKGSEISNDFSVAITAGNRAQLKTDTVPPVYHPRRWKDAFLKKHPDILNVGWVMADTLGRPSKLLVWFKDSTRFEYDLSKKSELKAFEEKYGPVPGYASVAIKVVDSSYVIMPDEPFSIDASPEQQSSNLLPMVRLRRLPNDTTLEPLIIIDGIPQPKGLDLNTIVDPNTIDQIEVLKNELAVNAYGEAGRNGVILLETKPVKEGKTPNRRIDSTNLLIQISEAPVIPDRVLYVVDGVEYEHPGFEELNLDVNTIQSINVLKGKEAVNKYGDKGANGVILVETKKTGKDRDSKGKVSIKNHDRLRE